MKQTVFNYYQKNQKIMHNIRYLFVFASMFNITFNTITMGENFEDLKFLESYMKDSDGLLRRWPVWILRFFLLVFSFVLTFLTKNIAKILTIAGSVISPWMSYIFPVSFGLILDSMGHDL